ncbi:hypothetical protein A0H81_10255 [Grifola frondosa]|uniref:Uncharacterized protein n=1 Tax=Grifola frondosa TaxID=5627 RepID=A0A1C7LYW3_GRIFR|nr:hypothetical protein A0H81_10255 [Grifola frondosa]
MRWNWMRGQQVVTNESTQIRALTKTALRFVRSCVISISVYRRTAATSLGSSILEISVHSRGNATVPPFHDGRSASVVRHDDRTHMGFPETCIRGLDASVQTPHSSAFSPSTGIPLASSLSLPRSRGIDRSCRSGLAVLRLRGAARSPASLRNCRATLPTLTTSSFALHAWPEHTPPAGRPNRVRAQRTV